MAIQLNSLDIGALAALAGNTTPNLDLPLWGNDNAAYNKAMYEGIVEAAKLQKDYALMAHQKDITKMEQEGTTNRELFRIQSQKESDQDRLAQDLFKFQTQEGRFGREFEAEQAYKNSMLGFKGAELGLQRQGLDLQRQGLLSEDAYRQGNLANDQERAGLEKLKLALEAKAQQDEVSLKKQAAASAGFLVGLNSISDPKDKEAFKKEYLASQVRNGNISQEEAVQAMGMSDSMLQASLIGNIQATEKAFELKNYMPPTSMGTTITQPDGTVIQTSPATKQETNQLQKKIVDADTTEAQFKNIDAKMKPEYFQYYTQLGIGASKEAERFENTPVIGTIADKAAGLITGKNKDERSANIKEYTNFKNDVMQALVQKVQQISGVAVSEQEYARLEKAFFSANMAPSEFNAGLNLARINNILGRNVAANALNKGINTSSISPSDFTSSVTKISPEQRNLLKTKYKAMGFSDEKIDAAIKKQYGE